MKAFKALLGAVCAVSLMGCSATPQQEAKADDDKNAVIETIMTRRSVRKYQPQAVNRDTMQTIEKKRVAFLDHPSIYSKSEIYQTSHYFKLDF